MASLLVCMYFDVGYSIEASAGYVWLEQIHDMIAVQFYVSSYYHGFQNYRELLVEISNTFWSLPIQVKSCDSCSYR